MPIHPPLVNHIAPINNKSIAVKVEPKQTRPYAHTVAKDVNPNEGNNVKTWSSSKMIPPTRETQCQNMTVVQSRELVLCFQVEHIGWTRYPMLLDDALRRKTTPLMFYHHRCQQSRHMTFIGVIKGEIRLDSDG